MATLSANYRESAIASLADLETNINAFFTAADTRLQALPGGATFTLASGLITVSILADDGAGIKHTHKYTQPLNIALIADSVTLVAAIEIMLAAILAESRYSILEEVTVTLTISLSN